MRFYEWRFCAIALSLNLTCSAAAGAPGTTTSPKIVDDVAQEVARRFQVDIEVVNASRFGCERGDLRQMELCTAYHWVREEMRMKASYSAALKRMSEVMEVVPGAASALVDSQKAWTSFRDLECRWQGLAAAGGGPTVNLFVMSCLAGLNAQRALSLDGMLTEPH